MLSLIGLIGWGSIPLHALCLGRLLTFIALWGMAYAVELSTTKGREDRMEAEQAKTEKPSATTSLVSTLWAIGTGTWSGLALSG